SPLVGLDRERCVLCARCTRFCDEISGDRFLELYARGAGERVAIAAGEDFRSPFSGNTIQICPVGALTATPYRFVARPFDISTADSVCPHCSAGCNLKVDLRRGEVVRQLARDNLDVNDTWSCDKGRFAYRFPDAETRVTTPLIRDRGLEPASFGEVTGKIAEWCRGARVAFLTGGRLMDEDYYALSKLARTVMRTNDLDHRRVPGSPRAERLAAASPMTVTNTALERAKAILVVGLDAEQEIPILHLRLRKAARRGAKIWVVHPRRTRLHDVATHVLVPPGDEAAALQADELSAALQALRDAEGAAVIISGERLDAAGTDAAMAVSADTGAAFTMLTRRANDRGALRAGVHPSMLPGGRSMEEAADVESVWGPIVQREPGRDGVAILQACADREIDVLFLIGVDPLRDAPDAALARRALANVPVRIVQSLELGSLAEYADAFLPAAAFVEKDGHVTNWEGRGQRIRPVRATEGISRPDWEIFTIIAGAMGADLGFTTLDELHGEMGSLLAARPAATVAAEQPPTAPALVDGLRLFTYPLLVDEGRLSEGADELKAALGEDAFVEVHPDDAGDLTDGETAIVTTPAGSAELPVRVTEHIAKGAVFVPFNQPGLAANTLLSGTFTTSVTLAPADVLAESETA
ncbi:MAG: molybdopterin-dependent oxidoreductase, partial [Actinomycetota bacterium]